MEKHIEDAIGGISRTEVKQLHLDNRPITEVSGLDEFVNLEVLSLANVGLTTLKGFPKLPNLQTLKLPDNKISFGLNLLHECPKLVHLDLSGNEIKSIEVLQPLEKLKCLKNLYLSNCEVTQVENFKGKVFELLRSLINLNGFDRDGKKDSTEVKGNDVSPVRPVKRITRSSAKKIESNETISDAKDPPVVSSDINMETDEEVHKDPQESKGTKRQSKNNGLSPRKKRKSYSLCQAKNALMQLNELKPGLKYVMESQSGPPHNPEFIVSVEVNDQKYIGSGNSKQLAKHAAAQAALSSFVQFRNMPEAMTAISKNINTSDFTTDNVENETYIFNKFEPQKNGKENELLISSDNSVVKKPLKILTEADKKNPVMLLNEIHPGLTFTLIGENSSIPSQRFRMRVEVNSEVFEGTGPNKKLAKASAARAVLCKLYSISYSLYPSALVPKTSLDAELFQFPQAVADNISKLMMDTFNEVMLGNPENAKWKVIAGIAMTKDEAMEDIQVLSIGTGTKCINGEHISMNGATLNDCHAEIISRRCLKDFFYTQLELHVEGEPDQSIFIKREEGGGFCLRPHMKFHLYISTAPCGDARIFSPHEEALDPVDKHPNRKARGVLRTKIESGEGTIPVKPGQHIQTWDGILPGQERLLTMSCSDKIASWNILGLQGALLSHFVEPIYLDSIILGGLFHPSHLHRAMFGRIEGTLEELPEMYKLNKPKMCAITSPETRHLVKSPNFSINWTTGLGRAEVVNATTGKTENGQVSRLAKRSFFQRFSNIHGHIPSLVKPDASHPTLYAAVKSVVKDYKQAKKQSCLAFSIADLGNWVKKPIEQNEFELTF